MAVSLKVHAKKLARLLKLRYGLNSVTVRQPTVSDDGAGGVSRAFTDRLTDPSVAIQPISGDKRRDLLVNQIDVTHNFYFFSDPQIVNGDKLQFDSEDYEIVDVQNIDKLDVIWKVMSRQRKTSTAS